jgi:dihydrodipicolinate synthase/N-acetylneuraminate lyase
MSQATSATGGHSPAVALLGYLLARNGDRQQATAIQQRLLKKSTTEYVSPLSVALVSVGLGDNDEAFRQLRLAVANHVPAVCQVAADPVFDPLRSDPRYAEIVRGIGLKSNR